MSDPISHEQAEVSRQRGLAYVFMAGVLWSTVGLGIRLIEDAEAWQILFFRSWALSALLFCVLWLRSGTFPLSQILNAGTSSVIGGFALVAAYGGGIFAVQSTSVANAMLLFASAPFFTAILGRFVLGEKIRRATMVSIVVAAVGIAIMVSGQSSTGSIIGNAAALVSAFGFAVFTIALRWGKTTEMLPSVFLSGIFAIVIMAAVCTLLDLPLVLSTHDTSIALVMGVFQVGAGLVLYTLGSKTVPAAELTLLSLAEVLLAPVWVWIFLGETAGIYTLTGGAVLLAAIVGNAVSGQKRRPPPITTP